MSAVAREKAAAEAALAKEKQERLALKEQRRLDREWKNANKRRT